MYVKKIVSKNKIKGENITIFILALVSIIPFSLSNFSLKCSIIKL